MAASGKDELELLERVFLRVASAETDDQLEKAVGNFLCPVLLKVGSPHQEVKNKNPLVPPFVANFTILYLRMGFPRLAHDKQVELAPLLIKCIQDKPQPQQDCLLQLVLPVLGQIKIPDSEQKRREMFEFHQRPQIRNILLEFLLDVLLMPYRNTPRQPSTLEISSNTSRSLAESPVLEQTSPASTNSTMAPPGLSVAAVKRISGDSPWDPSNLEQVKLGILKFLASDLFEPSDVICHFIVATGDSRHSVLDNGEHELKRLSRSTDFEDPKVVSKMCAIFQGSVVMPGSGQQVTQDLKRLPAGVRLKQKIFPNLLRSRKAADQFPACLQIIFESLFGQEPNIKLRVFAVQLVHHVCLWSSDKVMGMMGPVLVNGMTKLIEEDKQDPQLRRLGYTAIGKLAKRLPVPFSKDVALIQRLFQALCQETSDTRLAVQEALSMMAPSYRKADVTTLALIEALILNYVEQETHQARLVAVQFANAVFPRMHVASRYVCMLAVADVKDDVKEEAKKGLRAYADVEKLEEMLPAFPDMVAFVAQKGLQRVKGKARYTAGTAALPFAPPVFSQVLLYLRQCLEHAAGVTEEDRVKNCTLTAVAPHVEKLVAGITSEDFPSSAVGKYIELARQALHPIGGADLHAVALHCLLEVVAVAPAKLACLFHEKLEWIQGFTTSSREEARNYAGQLLAIVASTMNEESLIQLVRELSISLDSELVEMKLSSVSTLGFVIARHLYQQALRSAANTGELRVEDMEVEESNSATKRNGKHELLSGSIEKIVELINSRNTLISCTACNAVGEIGRSGFLPLPAGETPGTQEKSKSDVTLKEPMTKLSVVDKLLDRLQNAKENKVQEKAARALGFLCVGDEHFPHHKRLIHGLCEASKIRQVELQFTVGEALSCVGAGRLSEVAQDSWAVEQLSSGEHDDKTMQELIDVIVNKYANSGIPYVRQAACIWILSLVKYSGSHQVVQANLKEIQMVLMNMLAEADDLTQEVASKGLGLVYEYGGEDMKDELVSLLVDTLMTGKRRTQQVTEDTKIFAEGELGRAPEGGGLSTYKELCSIASDLNQPDLIYKFMHLANHNAMWNSRKGAAFGFSSIAALSRKQLEPYLPKIVPKLFRYQYDPNMKIQQAMLSIWSALVPETKKTVDTYMKEILRDLISSLGNNLWRVRQSSCMALSDLLSGRPVDDILESLPKLWELCFRARDDIKESVRQAAEVACRTLSKVSIRVCDVNQGKLGETAIALVLPTLLHKGLGNRAEEVRAVSLSTILKISKNAGTLLKPHIPLLVIALLESLSGLENQSLNYLSLQLHKGEEVQEKLEGARIAASKMSPMMETINMCVQYVDESVLSTLVPRLSDLLRTGIGLGTKAGSAGFVVSLSMQCQQDLTPYAGKLLSALLSGLSDRSASVRKSYATAIGHLVKVAKDSSIEKVINRIKNWYFDKEDESLRVACGLTLQAMTRYSPDVLRRHTSKVLPTVFFAVHEKKKATASSSSTSTESVWEEIWLENTPGTEAGIRLYLEEIVAITCASLTSQSWTTKAQAAVAISAIAQKLGPTLSQPHLGQLLSALVSGLSGRTWTGKEALLDAISCVCLKCRKAINDSSPRVDPDIQKVLDAVFKECRKENRVYKMAALKCFGAVVEEYSIDRFQEISELLFSIIAPEPKKDGEDEEEEREDDEDEKDELVNQEFLVCAFDCLGHAWPTEARESQDKHVERFCSVLMNSLTTNTWRVQLVILGAMKLFIRRMDWKAGTPGSSSGENIDRIAMLRRVLEKLVPPVCECLEVKKYAAVRLGAVEALETLQSALQGSVRLSLLTDELKEHVLDGLKFVYNDKEPNIRDKAAELRKSLLSVHS